MAQIALHPQEAKRVLKGFVDDNTVSFKVAKATNPYRGIKVISQTYLNKKEVTRGYKSFKRYEIIDKDAIEEDYPELMQMLNNPMEADITPDEANEQMDDLLGNAQEYMDVLITEDADKSFEVTKEQRETLEARADE